MCGYDPFWIYDMRLEQMYEQFDDEDDKDEKDDED